MTTTTIDTEAMVSLTDRAAMGAPVAVHPDTVTADAGAMGDDILRSAAAGERVRKVRSFGRNFDGRSVRAWTISGNVD